MTRIEPGSWLDRSWQVIDDVHRSLPENLSFDARQKAIQNAYPFGERKYHPYKMWLKAQRDYLRRYAPSDHDSKRFPLSPLERMMLRAGA